MVKSHKAFAKVDSVVREDPKTRISPSHSLRRRLGLLHMLRMLRPSPVVLSSGRVRKAIFFVFGKERPVSVQCYVKMFTKCDTVRSVSDTRPYICHQCRNIGPRRLTCYKDRLLVEDLGLLTASPRIPCQGDVAKT